jgi:hypothetical protein
LDACLRIKPTFENWLARPQKEKDPFQNPQNIHDEQEVF